MKKTRIAQLDEAKEISPGNTSILVSNAWKAKFYRVNDEDFVWLSVYGERDGLKARMGVSMEQIRQIVPKLEGSY